GEITDCRGNWAGAGCIVDRWLKRAITVTEEDRHIVRGLVCRREIGFPIAVEIADDYIKWVGSSAIVDRRLKRAVANAKQYRNLVHSSRVGHREIDFAIAIEVTRGHSNRPGKSAHVH